MPTPEQVKIFEDLKSLYTNLITGDNLEPIRELYQSLKRQFVLALKAVENNNTPQELNKSKMEKAQEEGLIDTPVINDTESLYIELTSWQKAS